jgi:hypothetical protein
MVEDTLIQELSQMVQVLQADRKPYESVWSEITDAFYDRRLIYKPENQNASPRPPQKYSTRAKRALKIASSGFQGYTADRRSDWMVLTFEDQTLMGQYMVQDWLEFCQRELLAHFSRAGFYETLAEAIQDAMAMGTGIVYCEEDITAHKIAYRCPHPKAVWMAEGAYQQVDTVVEEVYQSYRSFAERYGVERLHPSWQQFVQRTPFASTTILRIVMPMDTRYLKYASRPISSKFPFIIIAYDPHNQHIIDVGGYWEMPYLIWRYDKSAGEVYGRGPGFDVIDDNYIANQMVRSRIALGNLIADPPMMVDAALEGSDFVVPGYHIYTTGPQQRFEPVPLGSNYPITVDNENKIEAAIDAHFNVPVYQLLEELEARQRTATEVIEMAGERVAILGSTVGRFELEALQPAVRRSFNILARARVFPDPPQAIIDALREQKFLKVEFMGRLSQMQRRYYKSDGLNQAFNYIMPLAQIKPDALDNVDFDALTRESLESIGAPATVIREKEDVEKLRQQRAEAMAQQQQQQMALIQQQNLLNNADKLGKAPQPGSPMEQAGKIMGGANG